MKNNNISIMIKILDYFFMFVTILQCDSIYTVAQPPFHISKVIINILWQLVCFILFIYGCNNLSRKSADSLILFICIIALFFACIFIYNIIIYPSFSKSFIFKVLIDPIFLIVYFYSCGIQKIFHMLISFEKIIIWISYISILSWLMFLVHIPTNTTLLSSWGVSGNLLRSESGYFGLSFFVRDGFKFFGINWIRNAAIFSEASIFAYLLIIAMLIELFVKHNDKILNKNVVILLIATISTASTIGILVTIPAIIYHAIIIYNNNSISMLLIMFIPFILWILKSVLIEKIGQKNGGGLTSSFIRFDDIRAGIKAWLLHPILGSGLGNLHLIKSNMNIIRFMTPGSEPSDSAGFTTVLAQGGIVMGLFYLLPNILFSRLNHRYLGICIFTLIPFIFVTAQVFYIYIILLSYFWAIILRHYEESNIL